MCDTCGCNTHGAPEYDGKRAQGSHPMASAQAPHSHHHEHEHSHGHGHSHSHDHSHEHGHEHVHAHSHDEDHRVLEVQRSLLEHNARLGERLRGFFLAKKIPALNFLSSPGSGKTTLLEKTIAHFSGKLRFGVVVGDLATDNDANRLRAHGAQVVQVTTGTVCHLDAHMVMHAIEQIDTDAIDIMLIENVGNLVCPASFDLGESHRVVLLSATEGEDKPLKYPPVFSSAQAVVITKTDLAEAAGFDLKAARESLAQVAPHAKVFELSAKTGAQMNAWLEHIRKLAGK